MTTFSQSVVRLELNFSVTLFRLLFWHSFADRWFSPKRLARRGSREWVSKSVGFVFGSKGARPEGMSQAFLVVLSEKRSITHIDLLPLNTTQFLSLLKILQKWNLFKSKWGEIISYDEKYNLHPNISLKPMFCCWYLQTSKAIWV